MREREKITKLSNLFDVPFSWAISCRIGYYDNLLRLCGDVMQDTISLKPKYDNEFWCKWVDVRYLFWKKQYRKIQFWIDSVNGIEKNKVTNEMIIQARAYPMIDLLGIVRDRSVHCPFHEDKHPSASVKNNKLHCFVCNKTWNTIDYMMEKEGLTFIETVVRLSM